MQLRRSAFGYYRMVSLDLIFLRPSLRHLEVPSELRKFNEPECSDAL